MMAKIVVVAILALLTCATSYADNITWGAVSLADNDGGAFLQDFNITSSGTTWILTLPNFSQSDFAAFSGEISLSLSADDVDPNIIGVTFQYLGAIDQSNGPADVSYIQTVSGAPDVFGTFNSTPFTGFLALSPSNHIDLTTTIDLNDNGGSASINQIEFHLATVPEPSSLIMLATGLAMAWHVGRRKR